MSAVSRQVRDLEWWRERLVVDHETPDGFMAACPVHGGSDSLHVTERGGEDALVYCHAQGCPYDEILATVEEEPPEFTVTRTSSGERGPIARTSDFAEAKRLPLDLLHKLGLGERVEFSFADGTAHVRHRSGEYSWSNGGKAKKHPLWPEPPEQIGETVYITEGESDALTLRMAGFEAYAITSGAQSKPVLSQTHYAALARRGMRRVVITGDADDAGRAWTEAETSAARAAGVEVAVLDWSPHYDPFDPEPLKDSNELWQTCETVEEFRALVEQHTYVVHVASRLLDLDAIYDAGEQEPDWLVENVISPGEKGVIVAPPKSYKTWLALKLARAVALGEPFLGRSEWHVRERRPVLIVEEEGTLPKFARRVVKVLTERDGKVFLMHRRGMDFRSRAHVDQLIQRIQELDAGLVILDPLQRMQPGVNENDAGETEAVWTAIHRIAASCPRAALVILHHSKKDAYDKLGFGTERGGRIGGEVDFALFVRVIEPGRLALFFDGRDVERQSAEDGDPLEVVFPVDDPAKMKATGMRITITRTRKHDGDETYAEVAQLLDGDWRRATYFAEQVGISRNNVKVYLDRAIEEGVAERRTVGQGPTAPVEWRAKEDA